MASDSAPEFPSSTIEHFVPSRGYVTLAGTVMPGGHQLSRLAVMPFVWRFAPAHGANQDHGWRRASKADYYLLNDKGEWSVTDVRPGVQYAVIVVHIKSVQAARHPDRIVGNLLHDNGGMLPYAGLGLPEFTHQKYGIHIGSAPDDHLTGAVLGVGRATWEEPGIDAAMSKGANLRFRMAAWATKEEDVTKDGVVTRRDVTYYVGERPCEASGYWTFGDLDLPLKRAKTFTVALVTAEFKVPAVGGPSVVPPLGGDVIGLNSHPHQPLRTHGSRRS
jgi:hypothetical protein